MHPGAEFLSRFRPGGPWVVTRISDAPAGRTGKSLQTSTFSDLSQLSLWIAEADGQVNLYFQVNPLLREPGAKSSREDVARVEYLHVDWDFPPGDPEDQLPAAEARLRSLEPPPTCAVFSGGGVHAYWRLSEPIEIGGDLARAEEAASYNRALEQLVGGDHCHNVDRIMRIPGTTNIPDGKKIAKGRSRCRARVLWHEDSSHPISLFHRAAGPPAGHRGSLPAPMPATGNLARVWVEDLPVSDDVKAIVVQGTDVDDATRFESRSEALFYVCCALARADVPPEQILAVITDRDYGISSSVLDKGSGASAYAWRQVTRASDEAVAPELREMNDRFAVVGNYGGKCRVIEEVIDPGTGRPEILTQSFADHKDRFSNRRVVVGTDKQGADVFQPLGAWWLGHPKRRQYDQLKFLPGQPEVVGPPARPIYNLWRGFAFEPRPGDCSLYLQHLREHVCSGEQRLYDYLLNWMARAVQRPDRPGETAIVLRGSPGTGKGFAAKEFGALFGSHFRQLFSQKHLVGNFNAALGTAVVVFADEANFDRRSAGILKGLVTEGDLAVERKFVDVTFESSCLHLIFASDRDWIVPVDAEDRRFVVLDVVATRRRDFDFFSRARAQMRSGGGPALLHLLLERDISRFEVRAIPDTGARRDQKLLSLGSEEEWWRKVLDEGRLLPEHGRWEGRVPTEAFLDYYLTYAQRTNARRRANATALGRFLRGVLPAGWPRRRQHAVLSERWEPEISAPVPVQTRPYFYEFPALGECRAAWEAKYEGDGGWTTDEPDEAPITTRGVL